VICAYIDQYKHQFGGEPICRTHHRFRLREAERAWDQQFKRIVPATRLAQQFRRCAVTFEPKLLTSAVCLFLGAVDGVT